MNFELHGPYRTVETKFAIVNESQSGDQQIVGPPGDGKRILVTGYHLTADGTVNVRWKDGSDFLTGPLYMTQHTQLEIGGVPEGHFVCGDNRPLELTLSASQSVGGAVQYVVQEKIE